MELQLATVRSEMDRKFADPKALADATAATALPSNSLSGVQDKVNQAELLHNIELEAKLAELRAKGAEVASDLKARREAVELGHASLVQKDDADAAAFAKKRAEDAKAAEAYVAKHTRRGALTRVRVLHSALSKIL